MQVVGGRGGGSGPAGSQPDEDGEPTEGSGGAGAIAGAAKRRVVAAMMKKFLADEMLPVLLELRGVLAAARSPLAGALSATLMALLAEHKSEVCGNLLSCMFPSFVFASFPTAQQSSTRVGCSQCRSGCSAWYISDGMVAMHAISPGAPLKCYIFYTWVYVGNFGNY